MEGLASLFEGVTSLLRFINPFDEDFILKGVLDFLGNILSYLNPFDENFFGYKIIELLGDLLKSLFIPSEERLNAFPNIINAKFAFIDSIKYAVNSIVDILDGLGNPPTLTIPVGATKYTEKGEIEIINLDWYAPYKPYGDLIITGFVYAFFVWRLFVVTIPALINGSSGYTGETTYSMVYPEMLNSGTKRLSPGGRKLLK